MNRYTWCIIAVTAILVTARPTYSMPTREGAVQVLRDLRAALNKRDFENGVTLLHLSPNSKAYRLKRELEAWLELGAFSSQRIEALAQYGRWGKLDKVYHAHRVTRWTKINGVALEECYGLALPSAQTEAGFYWNGERFKVMFYIDAETRTSTRRLVERCLRQITNNDESSAFSFYHLQRLGPEAKAAVPAVTMKLTEALKHQNSYVRIRSAFALWNIDHEPKMIPFLVESLKDQGIKTRDRALASEILGIIGPEAKTAVPVLTDALQEQDGEFRVTAARALWRIAQQREVVRPVLINALKHGHKDVFSPAAYTLGEIGLDKASIFALIRMLKDPDRASAAHRVVPALGKAAKDKDVEVRRAAVSAIALIPPWSGSSDAATLSLREALKDQDREVRIIAAERLKKIGKTKETKERRGKKKGQVWVRSLFGTSRRTGKDCHRVLRKTT